MITIPSSSLFRAYDIRGIVGQSLHAHDMRAIGHAFASEVIDRQQTRKPTIVLVRDGRLSSPMLADALAEGMIASGAQVIDCGVGPSPYGYFAAQHFNADGCAIITGSHNPKNHNGMKATIGGKPFFGDGLLELRMRLAQNNLHHGKSARSHKDVRDAYVARLATELATISLDFSVIWDAGNGAAGDIITQLTSHIAALQHVHLYCTIDGNFPNHHPDPSDAHTLSDARNAVLQHKHAIGLAFDGDGDRLGVIDERGRIISPDHLLMLLARDVLAESAGATIIADVKTSDAFFADVKAHGGHGIMGKTGHALIKEQMQQTSAAFAGEASGHLFFADRYYGYDDALYAAVRLLRICAQTGEELCDMVDALPTLHTSPEWRIYCDDDKKFAVVDQIAARCAAQGLTVNTLDGVRVSTQHGWWLIRASNTQAALVARCEGNSAQALVTQCENVRAQLSELGVAIDSIIC